MLCIECFGGRKGEKEKDSQAAAAFKGKSICRVGANCGNRQFFNKVTISFIYSSACESKCMDFRNMCSCRPSARVVWAGVPARYRVFPRVRWSLSTWERYWELNGY